MALNSILLIDDDEDDHLYFKDAINSINPCLTIDTATNGKDAFDRLKESKTLPDIIFLDLNMPVMNGYEFLVYIKKEKKLCDIPLGIYSTSNSSRDSMLTKEFGAIFFLTKPKDFGVLCNKLKQILEADHSKGDYITLV